MDLSTEPQKRGRGRPKGSRNKGDPDQPRPRAPERKTTIEKRARIIEAAIEAVASVGVRGATLGDIADRAGTTRGGIEHYFATRRELFIAALGEARKALSEVEATTLNTGDLMLHIVGDERLRAFWRLAPLARAETFGMLLHAAIENGETVAASQRNDSVALDLAVLAGLLEENAGTRGEDVAAVIAIHGRSRDALLSASSSARADESPTER